MTIRGSTRPDASDRGQTTPDFLVGVTIFLVTVAFVVAFVPQLLAPYQDQDHAPVSERVAGTLAGSLLADAEQPGTLNETCTIAFLTQTGGGDCPFDTSASVTDQVGVESWYGVNVTLSRDVTGGPAPETLCADAGSVGACGTDRLAVGPSIPGDHRAVATAQRTVVVDGRDAVLEVTVW